MVQKHQREFYAMDVGGGEASPPKAATIHRHDTRHSPFVLLCWSHVSRPGKSKHLRGHLQALPPRCPRGCKRVSVSIHHGRLLPVRRTATLPALGTVPGQGRSPGAPSEQKVALMFDPDAAMPRLNRGMVYLGACLIAGIRLARE